MDKAHKGITAQYSSLSVDVFKVANVYAVKL
jgi:hypothetical protein